MKSFWLLSIALSVCSASIIRDNGAWYDDGERYLYFPGDGDYSLHIIDLDETVDQVELTEFLRDPDNNGYWLYTRSNPTVEQVLGIGQEDTVRQSSFDARKEIVVLVHGWRGNGKNDMNAMLRDAFLEAGDYNVIVLDWSRLAGRSYGTARTGVPALGRALGQFLSWLVTLGASYNKMHLVGFSLGGHLVGAAGREANSQVKRITALDPAGPNWGNSNERVVPSDAQYVEVIHTNTGLYGYSDPCGDVDHYPNGGNSMPGCWVSSCSHSKAYEYMTATVRYNHLHANQCETLREATRDRCVGQLFTMGDANINKSGSGIYRVNTARSYPF